MPISHLKMLRADNHPHQIVFQGRRFSKWVKLGLPVLCLAVLWFLYHAVPILFSSLIVSVGLYYLLNPVVDFLETHSIRRSAGTALVLLSLFFLFYLVWLRIMSFSSSIREEVDLDMFQKNIVQTVEKVIVFAEEQIPLIQRLVDGDPHLLEHSAKSEKNESHAKPLPAPTSAPSKRKLTQDIESFVRQQIMSRAFDMAKKVASLFANFLLISYFTFFFLKDGRTFKKNLIEWIPNRYFEPALKFFYELNRRMQSYLQNMLLDCTLVGTMVGLGSHFLGVPYPVVLGLAAFILNSMPLLGPALYTALGLIITIGTMDVDKSSHVALGYFGICVVSRLCDDFVFIPTIYGRSHHLHAVLVIAAVLVGESVAGAWGMFLAIPILSILLLGLQIVREISAGDVAPPLPLSAFHPFA